MSSSKFPVERLAVILTPVIFAPLAAVVSAWLATHFPGLPHVTPAEITGVEISAFLGAAGLVYKWLHGRQILMGPGAPAALGATAAAGPPGPKGDPGLPGPKGDPGVTPDQVRGFISEELNRRLSAGSPAQTA